MEHSPARGTSRCAPGALSLTAPVFRSSRAQKGAWCARDSTWAHGPGAHGESTILRRARRQPHQPHQQHQHQKPHTNRITSTRSHAPIKPAAPQHHTPTRINHITSTRNHAPIKPAAPATLHTNQYQPQQPQHQRQKPHTNHITSADKTTRQSSQQPRQHHTSTRSNRINHITSTRSHAPIKPAAPATLHTNPQQPAATAAPTPEATHQPPHQRRLHQRFLYCDGETPNISLKYFVKYFCVPKPTASETSTMLSPASSDSSWAALLSRMVRMNTEGFIP